MRVKCEEKNWGMEKKSRQNREKEEEEERSIEK